MADNIFDWVDAQLAGYMAVKSAVRHIGCMTGWPFERLNNRPAE